MSDIIENFRGGGGRGGRGRGGRGGRGYGGGYGGPYGYGLGYGWEFPGWNYVGCPYGYGCPYNYVTPYDNNPYDNNTPEVVVVTQPPAEIQSKAPPANMQQNTLLITALGFVLSTLILIILIKLIK